MPRGNLGRWFRYSRGIPQLYGDRFTLMVLRNQDRDRGRVGVLIDQSNLYVVDCYLGPTNTLYYMQDFNYDQNW